MNLKQAFSLALKSLSGSKLRAILTMLGIIIGVAAVIIIVSLVNGVTSDLVAQFEEMGATTINVSVMGRGGNRSVSIDDMQNLVVTLLKCENPNTCPHGRPTILKYTKYELEKFFKRVM